MKENGKTSPRPLLLVGNFLSMPQSPVFTGSTSTKVRNEVQSRGFSDYQCVQANGRSLNQQPSINHSLRVTVPAPYPHHLTLSLWLRDFFFLGGGGQILNLATWKCMEKHILEKSEGKMGFEPMTLHDLVGCSNHWATGGSMVSKGQFVGLTGTILCGYTAQ